MLGADVESPAQAATPGRVLVVDDEPEVRRMLARVLREYETSEVSCGRDAVELARERPFDLVVSDVQMPDMDGVELLRALHGIDPELSVVLLSGAPDLSTAMKAIEYGAFEYLAKPIELEKLTNSAARAIDACRKRREEQDALRRFRSGERVRTPKGAKTTSEVLTGSLLGGRYRVGKLIGAGGMGAVYEGVREDLAQMRVALKVLHGSIESDVEYLARFRREAETVAAINHPNIVRILDFHVCDGEPALLVMEYLDGVSLAQAIRLDGPFTQKRAAFVASQMLAALGAAHRAKVIHRDLKPENVFLTSMSGLTDIVKLLDFGIAKLLETTTDQKLTQTGAVLGTPAYMAPEHARGETVDARSDLYAVGCVLYEALTGREPFQAENYNALIFAIQQSEPLPLRELRPELDPEFAAIVMKAMAKDPNARFQTAHAMSAALSRWVSPSFRPSERASEPPSSVPFAQTVPPPSATPSLGIQPAARSRRRPP